MLILTTAHLDITLDQSLFFIFFIILLLLLFYIFYSFYISACDLVSIVVCLCVLGG